MSARPTSSGPYARLARFSARNKWWVVLGVLLVTLVAGVIGLPPAVDNDLLSMMPDDEPVVDATRDLANNGGVELLTIGLVDDEAPAPDQARDTDAADPVGKDGKVTQDEDSGRSERLEAYAAELAAALDAMEDTQFVFHEVDPDLAFRIGLFQLEPADVRELTSRLRAAVALGANLNPVVARTLLEMGETTDRLARAREVSMIGDEGRSARIVVRPVTTAQDREFAKAFYDRFHAVLEAHPPPDPAVRIAWVGGAHQHVVEDTRTISSDLGWTSGLAAVFVLFIVALAFRDVRATLIVFVPIVLANIWTLGLIALVVGHLNTFTAAGVPILIGLGIDFAVHLFGRYREIRGRGASLEDALAQAWERTGPPCVTAGLTSAGGFMALVAATFRGFSQIGIMLAFGLLACLAVMLILLPALIAIVEPNKGGRPLPGANVGDDTASSSSYRLAPTGLMVAVIATGVAGAIALPDLEFDYDMSTMRAEGSAYDELSEVERELAESSFAPLVVTYPSVQALQEGQQALITRREAGTLPFAGQIVSVENLIPSDGEERLEELQALTQVMRHKNIRHVYSSPARPIIKALMPLRELDLAPIRQDELPDGLLEMAGGGTDEHRLLVFPNGNVWDMRNALTFLEGLQAAVGDKPVAGPVAIQGLAYKTTSRDMPIVGGLALLLVGLLTAIDLRKPLFTVGAVGTLLAGIVWAGVALRTFGVSLSIVNVIGVPILLGIGIDVVIHLLHRLREEGPGGVRRAWRTTGVAALVSTGTTVASFAALLLASSRGIRSLGLLVVIGLSTITLVGALLLPLAWAAGWRITGRAPGQGDDDDDLVDDDEDELPPVDV